MNKEEEIEKVLARLRPMLGGADVKFEGFNEGVVTLRYYRPLVNPAACHVDRTKATKDIIAEVLEEEIKEVIPELKQVVLLGER